MEYVVKTPCISELVRFILTYKFLFLLSKAWLSFFTSLAMAIVMEVSAHMATVMEVLAQMTKVMKVSALMATVMEVSDQATTVTKVSA